MQGHLEASLQQDLEQIRSKVTEMGGLASRAIAESVRALVERDRRLAFVVILRDQYIDEIEKQLDRLCLEFLVRHQPAASLLRFAYATIKINLELERVGDYAESIAREALRLTKVDAPLPFENIQQLADLAIPMLTDAVQAFVRQDADLARKTMEIDQAVDLLRDKVLTDLSQVYVEGGMPFEALAPLLQATRRLERVSDQARNISVETIYMCTGEYAKHLGSEAIRVLFVDENGTCQSLMAEAIATSMGVPGFIFSSAALQPSAVDAKMVAFMASKGHDVSRVVPKALIQVPNLDHQHVIVLMSPGAKTAFPRSPRRAVLLDWNVPDPNAVQGTEGEITAAFERAYSYIEAELRDLVSAIRDSSTT
jgi:phosphate transport system protein